MAPRRRSVARAAATLALLSISRHPALAQSNRTQQRVRPGEAGWPVPSVWEDLNRSVGGHLIKVEPLLAACEQDPHDATCAAVLQSLRNPYYLGDQPAGSQSSGWLDAWTSSPSAYAVAAHTTADVVAAVNFARDHHLRLVIKGGGHSYLGGSNAPDSLLVWTHPMDAVTLHDSFIGQGCSGSQLAHPAVSVQTGARWMAVYNAVTTAAGRYVQGGGCATVGVAGLVLGSGFGSFSKRYGTAGASLLEAEIVTADGTVRIANACTNPDLFWALKGGGAGSLGVATRLTLRTHELPEFGGGVVGAIKANSDAAFRRLIASFTEFYAASLFNPHWGESVTFQPDNVLTLGMVFHDLDQAQAQDVFRPFLDSIAAAPGDYTVTRPVRIAAVPARHWWDPDYISRNLPSRIMHDARPGAPAGNVWWSGNQEEVGVFLHAYESAWLPATLLRPDQRASWNAALFNASRHWQVSLHFNKGLAGAPGDVLAAARDTAMNPAVAEAFALAIIATGGPPAYPGMPGPGPDFPAARRNAAAIARAIDVLHELVPDAGSYVSEASYADPDWRQRSFGPNYPRLLAVKHRYDPDGLFTTHHGVGSEEWSLDGFTRR
jgi:FAD/FMN-containing dehydrogenase